MKTSAIGQLQTVLEPVQLVQGVVETRGVTDQGQRVALLHELGPADLDVCGQGSESTWCFTASGTVCREVSQHGALRPQELLAGLGKWAGK